ncbi:hypothetical protein [Pseudoalteromonas rhizosphaerae]|uniref:hypothetical protein n=1 Tax=Pseudoalteromonas rhizosphaerae TaxID=2518973 RepID=UPI0012307AB4|nr:hypothetical protein [Pseudoalteromonas rhizosphaerae]
MTEPVKFPEGSQLSIVPVGEGAEPIVVKGFDSAGGTIGTEGQLNTDTVLSDEQVQYGKSELKDSGEREVTGRWYATDPGQIEMKAASDDGIEREFKIRIGKAGQVWTFRAVLGSFVMAELEAGKGLRFKAKMGINSDEGIA